MTLAVIGLGSNIDGPPQRLQEASHRLYMLPGLSNHRVSRVYSSPPMGPQDQPPFFNAVLDLMPWVDPVHHLLVHFT